MNLFYEEWKTGVQLSTKEQIIRNDFKVWKNKNVITIAIVYLNTNSISNKFDGFSEEDNFSIFVISEAKIVDTPPVASFTIEGFTAPYRVDRTCLGSGNKNWCFKKKKNERKTRYLTYSFNPYGNDFQNYFVILVNILDCYSYAYSEVFVTS